MENFTLPGEIAKLLQKFFFRFEKRKKEELYGDKLEEPIGSSEEMSLSNMRVALKLSKLLAD